MPAARYISLCCVGWVLCVSAANAQISELKDHDVDQPFDISADSVEVRDQSNTAVFSGNVRVEQGDLRLESERLQVFYQRTGDTPTILRLDARGDVEFTSPSESVKSAWSIYDVRGEIVTMGGEVRFDSQDARLVGDRLELNLRTGRTTLDGDTTGSSATPRVQGRFAVPKKSGR
ncbi:MAG: LptA/OstA family protein [Pseudomonadota bacterium]